MRKRLKKIKLNSLNSKYRRKLNVRSKISGTSDIPRVCITKTNKNLYIQAIYDLSSKTLFSVGSFGKNSPIKTLNKDTVVELGVLFVNKSREHKIDRLKLDRSGNKYTGLIKLFADSLRDNGLKL